MGWTTSNAELRTFLHDGATDKIAKRKPVFGPQDGTNKVFETFEIRRVTDFSTITPGGTTGVGVFVNGVIAKVDTDDLVVGEFALHTAPVQTPTADSLVASYYYQWFLDTELDVFLENASRWLGQANDITQTPIGLQTAALNFAAAEALRKVAERWSERWSQIYNLEDNPSDMNKGPVDNWMKLAAAYEKSAKEQRAGFYTRQDQPLAPNFSISPGRIPAVTPKR
jgi:hypothetical protein